MKRFVLACAVTVSCLACTDAAGVSLVAVESRASAIIGGQDEPGYPAIGVLFDGKGVRCTATLIRPQWVLTAGHCVRPGTFDRLQFGIGPAQSSLDATFEIGEVVRHPRASPPLIEAQALFDAALLRLAAPVPAATAAPIAVQRGLRADFVGREVVVVGFGQDDGIVKTGQGVKRQAKMPIARVDERTFGFSAPTPATCFGDSGGPALMEFEGETRIIGVSSTVNGCFGEGCNPCVTGSNDTRVDVLADWIASVLGEPFESCRDDATRCDCPGACTEEGLCDNAVCGEATCIDTFNCMFAPCEGASCVFACVQEAKPETLERMAPLVECLMQKCIDSEDPDSCLWERCTDELAACYGRSAAAPEDGGVESDASVEPIDSGVAPVRHASDDAGASVVAARPRDEGGCALKRAPGSSGMPSFCAAMALAGLLFERRRRPRTR